MNKKTILFFVLLSLIGFQCKNTKTSENESLDDFFDIPVKSECNILINEINIDTIHLDKIESSYQGYTAFVGDSIFFADKRFGWIFVFNPQGKFVTKHLGQGKGPQELNTGVIDAFLPLNDGRYMFFGSGWDCHIHKNNWMREKIYTIGWDVKVSKEEMMKNPKPDMQSLYTLSWGKVITRNINNKIIITITADYPPKYYCLTEWYYKTSRIFALMDINTGKVEKIAGRRSPVYLKYNFIGYLDFLNFDVSNKNKKLYVCYEPDSLIYIYNKDLILERAFGCAGKNIDTNYPEVKEIKTLRKLYKQGRKELAYYNWLEYIDERNLLFRSYKKGSHAATDGIQIYKDNVLIADIDVPKGLVVKGYIAPYFYSDAVIDEENETMKIYRFKLDL